MLLFLSLAVAPVYKPLPTSSVVYLGDNDWSARVFFVQHPREQGE